MFWKTISFVLVNSYRFKVYAKRSSSIAQKKLHFSFNLGLQLFDYRLLSADFIQ